MTVVSTSASLEKEITTNPFYKTGFVLDFSDFVDDEKGFVAFCSKHETYQIEKAPDGKIIIMPPTFFETGERNSELIFQLKLWNNEANTGRIGDSSTGYNLPDGSMRSPDASWILKERFNDLTEEQITQQFLPLCPDFVIELRSSSDSLDELKRKMTEVWIRNGCQLALLIDPKEEQVFIYRANDTIELITDFDNKVSGETVLPNFELDLSKLK